MIRPLPSLLLKPCGDGGNWVDGKAVPEEKLGSRLQHAAFARHRRAEDIFAGVSGRTGHWVSPTARLKYLMAGGYHIERAARGRDHAGR